MQPNPCVNSSSSSSTIGYLHHLVVLLWVEVLLELLLVESAQLSLAGDLLDALDAVEHLAFLQVAQLPQLGQFLLLLLQQPTDRVILNNDDGLSHRDDRPLQRDNGSRPQDLQVS